MASDNKTATLSLQGYRGTRDFYPPDQRLQNWLYGCLHRTLVSFGYEEYDGPLMEPFELYAAKSSEEIVNDQLYHLVDRGDRKIAVRPEMTPTLARMVAAKANQLAKPIRWFSIPTCMRYERPQRGRLREFEQLNVDVLGGEPFDEDVEIIQVLCAIMRSLGASDEDFVVKINHRGIVNAFLYDEMALNRDLKAPLLRLLDKRDKITPEDFAQEGKDLGLNPEQLTKLEEFLNCSYKDLEILLPTQGSLVNDFVDRIKLLEELVPRQCIKFDASVMRGFDYYTGMVFELYDTNPDNRRALAGGGRYDNLIGAFGVDPLPGIGFGAGDVGLLNFCEVHNLLPTLRKPTDVFVARFSENDRKTAFQLGQLLRSSKVTVETPLTLQKFGKQIQQASKAGAFAVAFRGEDEIRANTFAVKWLASGLQENYPATPEGCALFTKALEKLKDPIHKLGSDC